MEKSGGGAGMALEPGPGETSAPQLVLEKSSDTQRLEDLRATLRTEQERLRFLLETGKAINGILDVSELARFAGKLILDFSGADTCAVLLRAKGGAFRPVCVVNAGARSRGRLSVSRTIAGHVVSKRVAIITRSAREDARFMHGESIVMTGMQSVMCAPLVSGRKVLGILYVVSDAPTRQFDEGNLDLLNAFASQLAVAFENARMFELEEKLRMREREAALGRIAGEISHAIKNRLNGMIGPAEMIELAEGRDEVLRCAKDIQKGIGDLRDYVVNNLDYLRTGGAPPPAAGSSLRQTVEYCLKTRRDMFLKEGIEVTVRIGDDLPPVCLERAKAEIILDNLLDNAADAMRGAATRRVLITARHEHGAGKVVMEFTDTGCGIPPKNLERIFDDYFTTKTAGTGIGLAQTRAILQRQGGGIEARSEPGKGAAFILSFPVSGSAPEEERTQQEGTLT
ncbi:MAG: HAMP domain-containing sensor histidine kinase [bacterium]